MFFAVKIVTARLADITCEQKHCRCVDRCVPLSGRYTLPNLRCWPSLPYSSVPPLPTKHCLGRLVGYLLIHLTLHPLSSSIPSFSFQIGGHKANTLTSLPTVRSQCSSHPHTPPEMASRQRRLSTSTAGICIHTATLAVTSVRRIWILYHHRSRHRRSRNMRRLLAGV